MAGMVSTVSFGAGLAAVQKAAPSQKAGRSRGRARRRRRFRHPAGGGSGGCRRTGWCCRSCLPSCPRGVAQRPRRARHSGSRKERRRFPARRGWAAVTPAAVSARKSGSSPGWSRLESSAPPARRISPQGAGWRYGNFERSRGCRRCASCQKPDRKPPPFRWPFRCRRSARRRPAAGRRGGRSAASSGSRCSSSGRSRDRRFPLSRGRPSGC